MKNKKYIFEVLTETRKDLFRVLAVKRKIEYEIQKFITAGLKEKLFGKNHRFNSNSHYTFFDYRIIFDDYLEKVEYVIYYILTENLTDEKRKEIDNFKSSFGRYLKDEYIFEQYEVPSIISKKYKMDIEKLFENGIVI